MEGERYGDSSTQTEFSSFDEECIVAPSCFKGSGDFNCASGTDGQVNETRFPGLVARLMGLDSMPATNVFESQSLWDNCSKKRRPEFCINDRLNHVPNRAEGCSKKLLELEFKNMPSRQIERSKVDSLPQKSVHIALDKTLSPVKNNELIYAKNAVHEMEAAAEFVEPESKTIVETEIQPSCQVVELKESVLGSRRAQKLRGSSGRLEGSTVVRSCKGESLNKNCKASEDANVSKAPSDTDVTRTIDAEANVKSISLAVQAKVNVQRRKGMNSSSRSTLVNHNGEFKLNQPSQTHPNILKNKPHKKPSVLNSSNIVTRIKQKQNGSTSTDKFAPKSSMYNPERQVPIGDVSYGKKKIGNMVSRNSNFSNKKGLSVIANLQKEGLSSSNKDNLSVDGIIVGRDKKHIPHQFEINERSKPLGDNIGDGTNIISFTFTSSIVKPVPGPQLLSKAVEKWDRRNGCYFGAKNKRAASDPISENISSLGLNVLGADAFGLVLEQKLRKLASRRKSPYSFKAGCGETFLSIRQALASDLDIPGFAPVAVEKKEFESCKDELGGWFDFPLSPSPSGGQALHINHKLLEAEKSECSISCNMQKDADNNIVGSNFTRETSSSECYNSTISLRSTDAGKMHSSSSQTQRIISSNSTIKITSAKVEFDLFDRVYFEQAPEIKIGLSEANRQDREYLREILNNRESMFKELESCCVVCMLETLDSVIFEESECKKSSVRHEGDDVNCRMRRKVLLDCVKEYLDEKRNFYFRAGYLAWAKGLAVIQNETAELLYKEITMWESMGRWMIDELVEKDMSSHLGRWTDFGTEAFETGSEIGLEIFSSLIDEVAADFLIRCVSV